uniref:NERD domain-containing protein n=1 Tax=Trypanosoma vivax (strain Y486) TaxID=1055687 RepID=G0U7K4_TRYVY|nr:conserved hypothetical protein [Trypanosoma vivax Y486]
MVNYVTEVVYWLPSAVLATIMMLLVVFVLSLNRGLFRHSLISWSWRRVFSLTKMSKHDAVFRCSMDAEEHVEAVLRAAGWKHIFLRRRVYVPRLNHNREIDVIAVGPVVLVIEVKHWRGKVWCNGPRWFQQAFASKRALEFEDIMEDNLVKASALRRYIENDKRIRLPDYRTVVESIQGEGEQGTWYTDRSLHKQCGQVVIPVVVFTNPSVKLDPDTVKRKKNVYDLQTFRAFAARIVREERGTSLVAWFKLHFMELCRKVLFYRVGFEHCLSLGEEKLVSAAIRGMRTWDMVYFNNGRLVHGDIQAFYLPSVRREYDRNDVLDAQVVWFEGPVGFLRSLWLGSSGVLRLKLAGKKFCLAFEVPLASPHIRHVSRSDRLVIKMAGNRATETIALGDVERLLLSPHSVENID